MQSYFYRYARIIIILVAALALIVAFWPGLASAGPELPPRDPLDKSQDGGGGGDGSSVGAYIVLQTNRGAWAVVQWQDSAGDWHDVEGWRGSNDLTGNRRWWVHPKDFSTGPFRWVVMSGQQGAITSTSPPFILPQRAGEVVNVFVTN